MTILPLSLYPLKIYFHYLDIYYRLALLCKILIYLELSFFLYVFNLVRWHYQNRNQALNTSEIIVLLSNGFKIIFVLFRDSPIQVFYLNFLPVKNKIEVFFTYNVISDLLRIIKIVVLLFGRGFSLRRGVE